MSPLVIYAYERLEAWFGEAVLGVGIPGTSEALHENGTDTKEGGGIKLEEGWKMRLKYIACMMYEGFDAATRLGARARVATCSGGGRRVRGVGTGARLWKSG